MRMLIHPYRKSLYMLRMFTVSRLLTSASRHLSSCGDCTCKSVCFRGKYIFRKFIITNKLLIQIYWWNNWHKILLFWFYIKKKIYTSIYKKNNNKNWIFNITIYFKIFTPVNVKGQSKLFNICILLIWT